jgi:hypothetical protein
MNQATTLPFQRSLRQTRHRSDEQFFFPPSLLILLDDGFVNLVDAYTRSGEDSYTLGITG